MNLHESHVTWENDEARVDVLFSVAGVATTIRITSKFTGKMILLDVGDGALRDLLSGGSTDFVHEIDLIALTHGHFDHVGGLHSLLGFMRMLRRSNTLNVIMPVGCLEGSGILSAFRESYRESMPFRIGRHEVRPKTGFDTDFFKVHAIEVEHWGDENTTGKDYPMPALGYRVHIGQTIMGYTGDTRYCHGAEEVVRGTDLAIIECTHREPPISGPRVHLSEAEARRLGALAKAHLLIHRAPENIKIQRPDDSS